MAKKKTPADSSGDEELSFEEALAELEQIADDLESGELGLSQSLARYEQGVRRLRQCHALLAEAERKIELLVGVDEEGRAETAPFDDDDLSLDEKASQRGRRRSAAE